MRVLQVSRRTDRDDYPILSDITLILCSLSVFALALDSLSENLRSIVHTHIKDTTFAAASRIFYRQNFAQGLGETRSGDLRPSDCCRVRWSCGFRALRYNPSAQSVSRLFASDQTGRTGVWGGAGQSPTTSSRPAV